MLKKKAEDRPTAQEVLDALNGKLTKTEQNKNEANLSQWQHQKPIQQIQSQTQNSQYIFSTQHKGHHVTLSNKNATATNPNKKYSDDLALVQGNVLKKGSSIRFKIQTASDTIGIGMALKNVVAAKSYQFTNNEEIGHGCFLMYKLGSFSHSDKTQNDCKTKLKFSFEKDVIRVETNTNELLFVNETKNMEYQLKLNLTEDQWKQACFCVQLDCQDDSVSIL